MTTCIKRGRMLRDQDDVFSQNAWDDTEWTDEMREKAELRIEEQKREAKHMTQVSQGIIEIEQKVIQNWDEFYAIHEDRFFKDRKWIFSEFPELLDHLKEDSSPSRVFEVGCGVGNAVVHIIKSNKNANLHLYCCDLSQNAIKTLREREFYQENPDRVTAFQVDICQAPEQSTKLIAIEPESLDFIMLIFTLSAMKPEFIGKTISYLSRLLKPGGMFLVRDYARFDMTQLRFKGKSYLSENYYVRNDGTTSYFFTQDELRQLFMSTGCLEEVELKNDNRLLVNRLKSIKMCRCWIQAKFRKLST